MEEYIDIIGYEGYYQVSNFGNIKSIQKTRAINGIIKPSSRNGYYSVNLHKNNKISTKLVSRLVAIHFIPNTENKPMVNHKDGNKLNNNISNLEWVTNKENIRHAWDNGLCKVSDNLREKARDRKSIKVINTVTNEIYYSIKQAAIQNKLSKNWLRYQVIKSKKNKSNFIKYAK